MISGVHAVVFSREADKDRAFFRDVLGLAAVDAGGGWLTIRLPGGGEFPIYEPRHPSPRQP